MNSMKLIRLLAGAGCLFLACVRVAAQGTAFTYQGRLSDNGTPASGSYDLQFGLYDAETKGELVGTLITNAPVAVSNGLFTALLDFGAGVFNGSPRWLEIGARTNGAVTPHAVLVPRQLLPATPYAIHAGHAATVASNSVGAGQIVSGSVTANHLAANLGVWTKTGTSIHYEGGRVGIGTASPKLPLHVAGGYYGRGNLQLHAFQGDGSSGTAYVQARDDSPSSSVGLSLRTKNGSSLTDALYVSPQGNVGFGTEFPGVKLSLGNSTAPVKLALWESYDLLGEPTGASYGLGVLGDQFLLNLGRPQARFSFLDGAGGAEVVTIQGSGQMGIGVTTPQVPLHIRPAASGRGLLLGVDSGAGGHTALMIDLSAPSNGYAQLQAIRAAGVAWGDIVLNPQAGNVGIGKTNPATKLDVAGEATMTACNITSDRHAKEAFRSVEPREVLRKVAQLAITEWEYKDQPGVRHLGPMAQDFHAAFAVGRDEKHITTVDADGVALAAIQGLNEKLAEKESRIRELENDLAALKKLVERIAGQSQGGAR
jgi:hypothetical protein